MLWKQEFKEVHTKLWERNISSHSPQMALGDIDLR